MKAVVDYVNLDVSDGSPLLSALLSSVENEAKADTIGLTGVGNLYNARQPGLLTQGMAAWFGKNIAASRVAAISEMKNAFEADSRDTGAATGIYLENVQDAARQKTINAATKKLYTDIKKDAVDYVSKKSKKVPAHSPYADGYTVQKVTRDKFNFG